ncbi:protein-tyrosine phosphatase-like protein [Armillaria luteobubalina]|uniref:protein-tyrosine-phosphatase n=1 Tax=Armillaria luteobubalina TaxID=153913 RepID=A0AA39UDU5_9AGAR|nr:protein-tyrosine phosphatase-like protein [Armillaria luteobubalina]
MIRFDSIPIEIQQAMCTPMHRILGPTPLPNDPSKFTGSLYLGSLAAVCEKDLLREHHITHLVQVLDVPWLPISEKDGFSCYRIDILDQASSDLRPHLEDACNYIDRALRGGKSVLVHCQQGISRSASIVIAFLIRNRGMSYDSAYSLVKRERACIKPNAGFVQALQEWEALWRRPPPGRRFTS